MLLFVSFQFISYYYFICLEMQEICWCLPKLS